MPISQPTPLMRPGLASLTFNDLPIDALGPAPAHFTQARYAFAGFMYKTIGILSFHLAPVSVDQRHVLHKVA